MKIRQSLCALGAAVMAGSFSTSVIADPIADFYKNRTITIIVGVRAGGAYDLYARFFGDHAKKHIAGNPTIIYQYMPGGGGVKSANFLYNVAPKDGTVIGMLEQGTAVGKLLRDHPNMKFDITKFNWVGTVGRSYYLFGIWHKAPATTVEGAMKKEVLMAASGKSSTTYIYPKLANYILGTKYKPILGYRGAGAMNLSFMRGETHGRGGTWSSWKTKMGSHIKSGELKFALQIAPKKNPEWPNVPLLIDLAKTKADRDIVDFMTVPTAIGRSLLLPPGVPKARVNAIRRAFDATMKDPRVVAKAKKLGVRTTGETGEQLQALMGKLAATPPSVVKNVRDAIGMK